MPGPAAVSAGITVQQPPATTADAPVYVNDLQQLARDGAVLVVAWHDGSHDDMVKAVQHDRC